MIDEDTLQAALDYEPGDMTARLVLADYLEEQGDPRADGYRALARCNFRPRFTPLSEEINRMWVDNEAGYVLDLAQFASINLKGSVPVPIWYGLPYTWLKIRTAILPDSCLPWYWFDVVEIQNPDSAKVAAAASPRNGWSVQAGEAAPVPVTNLPLETALPSLPFKKRREAEDAAAHAFRYMPQFYKLPLLRGKPR